MESQNLRAKEIFVPVVLGLLLGVIPFLFALGATDGTHEFFGVLINVDDYKAYLSAIQQGRDGYWLFHYNFTPEQYAPQLMHLVYILIGKLAAILGGGNRFWFHASRLVFGGVSFFSFLFWVRSLFPKSKTLQWTSWLLISFGSGFGFFIVMIKRDPENLPFDLIVPEVNTITDLISSPHYGLAIALMALYFGALQHFAKQTSSWKWTWIASFAGIGIGLAYPYQIPMVGLVTGIWLIALAIKQKKIPWKKWGQGAIILTPLTFLLGYYALFARQDAMWEQAFVENHGLPSPSPWKLFLGFGLLAIFCILAIFQEFREIKKSEYLLPVIWVMVNLFVIYLPFPFALRFVLGFHIPIATLAAIFLEKYVMPRIENLQIVRPLFIGLSVPTTLLFVFFIISLLPGQNQYPQYYSVTDLEAVDWLATQVGEDDITFANYHIGGYIPTVVNTKVFMGQFAITVNYKEKMALGENFWKVDTSQSWREDFVDEWGIDFIYQGVDEVAFTGEWIELPWEIIYQKNGVTIYQTD